MREVRKMSRQARRRQDAHAALADDPVASASDLALMGNPVVADVAHAMDAIRAGSREVQDIVSVIDGIAFQTNILALNAAAEALRGAGAWVEMRAFCARARC
jgi:methyl-accepting chemotaxis protein